MQYSDTLKSSYTLYKCSTDAFYSYVSLLFKDNENT